MDDKIKKWSEKRKMGPIKFTLFYGLFLFGGIMFLVNFLMNGFYLDENRIFTLIMIPFSIIICGIGGILFGMIIWILGEKKYWKYQAKAGLKEIDQ